MHMALQLQKLLPRRDVCGNKAKRFFIAVTVRLHTLFSIVEHSVAYVLSHLACLGAKRLGAGFAIINKSTQMLHCNVQDQVFQYPARNHHEPLSRLIMHDHDDRASKHILTL